MRFNHMTNFMKIFCIGLCICVVSCGNPSQKPSQDAFTDSVADALANGGQIDLDQFQWTREPAASEIKDGIRHRDVSGLRT